MSTTDPTAETLPNTHRLSDMMVANLATRIAAAKATTSEVAALAREVQDYRRVTIPCPTCEGSGVVPEYHVPWAAEWLGCPDCEAVGRIPQVAIDMSPIAALCARHDITVEGIVALVDEVFSPDNDKRRGELHPLVLHVERLRRLARGEEA